MTEAAIPTLALIAIASVLSPLGAEFLRRFVVVPEVVIQIIFGIHIGPAAGYWVTSLVLALLMGVLFHSSGLVLDSVVVALCLTTTALGTLLPMLRDSGYLDTPFGPVVLSVGAIG